MVEVRLEGHAAELAALAAFLGLAGQLAVQRVQLASQLSVQLNVWPAQLGVRPAVQLVQMAVQLDVQLDVELVQLAFHPAVEAGC